MVKEQTVRFRFTRDHTHAGLPFAKGDEINLTPEWADCIAQMGSGHRIEDTTPAVKAKE